MIVFDYTKREPGGTSPDGKLVVCPVCGRVGAEEVQPWRTTIIHTTQQTGTQAYPADYCTVPANDYYNGGRMTSITLTDRR
jgi:hypothetical protein